MTKLVSILEGALQAAVALSALPSGALMMIFPEGKAFRMPLSMLEGSPFSNFFLPGLILFTIIGLGHAAAAVMSFRRLLLHGPVGAVQGIGLMIWIFVQVSMIGGGHWLQYLYFSLGVAEVSLAVLILILREPRR
ncbi:MAG: hypothetical protein NTW38_13225 [Candidatus Aminicenantes bacterium]|nr:hypothetical protein [Candidatus Aminicenantes bacterium]